MALAEYEKRNGQKVVSCGQIIYCWVPSTLYLATFKNFCRVLKTEKETGQEGVHVRLLFYPPKKKKQIRTIYKNGPEQK